MWNPLCVISFPSTHQGLNAFQKLREFRKIHETAYPLELVTQTEGKHVGQLLPKKKRGIKLMDQKANSIADMAAVLGLHARPPKEEEIERTKALVNLTDRPRAKRGLRSHATSNALEFQGKLDGVSIWWSDLLDAEYAETWPTQVRHGPLLSVRGKPVWPPLQSMAYNEVKVEEEEEVTEQVLDEGKTAAQVEEEMKKAKENVIKETREEEVYTLPEEPLSLTLQQKLKDAEERMRYASPVEGMRAQNATATEPRQLV